MKRVIFILFLLLVVGCRQSQQEGVTGTADLTIELLSPLQPTLDGSSEMSVRITDAAGAPVNDAALSIKGDMTHAGMVPVLAEAAGGQDGLYTFPFAWTMKGDWIVTARATMPDGAWAEQQFDLTVK